MSEGFTPWFGKFPPQLYGGDDEMKKIDVNFRVLLVIGITSIVLGVMLLIFPHLAQLGTVWLSVTDGLAVAFIVAGILSITVDWRLKKAILDDVVRASLGYMLPECLRPAMRWVYGQKIVCTNHNQTVEIFGNPNNTETVIVKTKLDRSFQNVSNVSEPIFVGVSIDEFFFEGAESAILEVGYSIGNKHVELQDRKRKTTYGLDIGKEKVILSPDTIVHTWVAYQEIRRANDFLSWFLSYPTQQPRVTVIAPKDPNYEVGFTYA